MGKMNPKYEPLFTPWKIGNVEIKNRIVLCPMGGTSLFGWMEPNHFDKEAAKFFLERARNNVGLIIQELRRSRIRSEEDGSGRIRRCSGN